MILEDVKKAFPELSLPDIGAHYSGMNNWIVVYENNPPWKKVKRGGLYAKGNRDINRLNIAKVLCDKMAKLTFCEQCDISVTDKTLQDFVLETLESNGFWEHIEEFLSYSYAFGGCAFKVFSDGKEIRIDYITGENFVPVSWNGKSITGGVFKSTSFKNDFYYTLFEKYEIGTIEHRLFKSKAKEDVGKQCPLSELYPSLSEKITYAGDVPLFSYLKPAVSNNDIYNIPLGISVFANSFDTLKGLDIAYDSLVREFILGKKRIIVPAECTQSVANAETGEFQRFFDPDDEVFVALSAADVENIKIADNTVDLRITEHSEAIKTMLNILCMQVGLSAGALSFDTANGLKTATEIVAQNNETETTIKSNKNLLVECFESLIKSIITLGEATGLCGALSGNEISVTLKDNVIIDDNTVIDNMIKLSTAGLIDKKTAIMNALKIGENEAEEILEKIKKEAAIMPQDVEFFGEDN